MGPPVHRFTLLLAASLFSAGAARGQDQSALVREAAAAIGRGDFHGAEKTLRSEVGAHSGDAWALSLLGVALDNQKKISEAEEFHSRAVALLPHSAEILNNYGTHLWAAGRFAQAETCFASALAAAPGYFNVLFNLGVMAAYAGHNARARDALEAALQQQPKNLDVLYRLASVEEAVKDWESAVIHLAQAEKLDTRRADVEKLLAVTTAELGALDDSVAAWDRYLKLQPNDDAARRERAYAIARLGRLDLGIADLELFVARHPDDPIGHYELGQAARNTDMARAMEQLDKALTLDPDYLPARAARGSLYYQEGKPASALPDLELVASRQPDNAANLDRLGQTYQSLDRAADAVRVLRKAVELDPNNSTTVLHFARALADAGQTEESKVAMSRFRQLGPEQDRGVPAGLVKFLSLTPEERHADYRGRTEKAIHDHSDDPAAQVSYLKVMIEDGNAGQVDAAAKRIAALKPPAPVLADAGHALLAGKYYALAGGLFEQAGDVRSADYHLVCVQLLLAKGKTDEAAAAMARALEADPRRPDLYRQAIALLVKQGKGAEALRRAEEGARALPDNREALLLKVVALEFAGHAADTDRLLQEIGNRWPEWPAVWAAQRVILTARSRSGAAATDILSGLFREDLLEGKPSR